MERREFLQVLPIAALAPKVVKEGVHSLELPKSAHYVVLVQAGFVDWDSLTQPGILPEGATGGRIIVTHGPPDEVIKFYALKPDGQDIQP